MTVDELTAPCQGTVVPLKDITDAAFASGALGPGIGIEPRNGQIVAPCSGTILAAMGSGHAFGIKTDDGVEVLVHVGVDTVQMNGEGFSPPSRTEIGSPQAHLWWTSTSPRLLQRDTQQP